MLELKLYVKNTQSTNKSDINIFLLQNTIIYLLIKKRYDLLLIDILSIRTNKVLNAFRTKHLHHHKYYIQNKYDKQNK